MEDPKIKNYLGCKGGSGVYQTIINHIPRCDTLIIPFLGNCGVLRNMFWPERVIGFDLDKNVIEAWEKTGRRIELRNEDSLNFLKNYVRTVSACTVIYCDPPYPLETRTSNKRYKYDWTDSKHIRFLKIIKNVNASILISTYPNSIYEEHLAGWQYIDFNAMTRGGVRTERLYMNFSKPTLLQCYSYIGDDFTDRQRIKRKQERFLKKFQALPEVEKSAIAKLLISDYFSGIQ